MKRLKLIACALIVCLASLTALPLAAAAAPQWVIGQSGQIVSDVVTLAGSGGYNMTDGANAQASFRSPRSIVVQQDGSVLVADTDNQLIRRIGAKSVSVFAGINLAYDAKGLPLGTLVDGSRQLALFNHPQGMALDAKGNVYVSDTGNHAIRKIAVSGQVTTIAGSGVPGSADGKGAEASFHSPADLAVASDGTLYVADTQNHAIRKITPDGSVTTLNAPSTRIVEIIPGYAQPSGDFADGPMNRAKFNEPSGIAIDAKGNLLVSDTGNQCIRYIDMQARTVSTIAGNPAAAYGDNELYKEGGFADGDALQAKFDFPKGIAVTPDGGLLIADSLNHAVRYLHDGKVATVAGTGGERGDKEGPELSARLQMPYDVAVDRDGTVYIADAYNNKIRKAVPYHYPAGLPADSKIVVLHNQSRIQFNVSPELKNNRLMVPAAAIGADFGYTLAFDRNDGKTNIKLSKKEVTITLTAGSAETSVTRGSGEAAASKLDAAPYIKEGRSFVPLRFLSEQLGMDVQWEAERHAVILRDIDQVN